MTKVRVGDIVLVSFDETLTDAPPAIVTKVWDSHDVNDVPRIAVATFATPDHDARVIHVMELYASLEEAMTERETGSGTLAPVFAVIRPESVATLDDESTAEASESETDSKTPVRAPGRTSRDKS